MYLSLRAYNAYDMIVNSPPSDNEIGNDLGLVSDGVGLYDPDNNERLVGLSSIEFDGQPLIEVLEKDITEYVNGIMVCLNRLLGIAFKIKYFTKTKIGNFRFTLRNSNFRKLDTMVNTISN